MSMILPLSFFVLTMVLLFLRRDVFRLNGWREVLLGAGIMFGLAVALSTSVLSAFKAIDHRNLVLFWLLAVLFTGALLWRERRVFKLDVPGFSLIEKVMLAAWAVFMAVLFFLAVYVPPNSWDAMTYHMSRVAHWQQNHHVAFYATHNDRQLWNMPLAEYIILHFQILAGHDRFANLVQWGGLLVSAVAAGLMAGFMGVSRRGQISVMLIATAVPMAVLQAASTQNDLVVAGWIMCFLAMLLKWFCEGRPSRIALLAGAAFGLALFTKGTAYIVVPVFLIIMLTTAFRHFGKTVILITCCLLFAVCLTGFFHYRNAVDYQGLDLGMTFPPAKNEVMSPKLFVSNLSRHLGVHLQTPYQKINNVFITAIERLHQQMGVPINDPRVTVGDAGFLLAVSAYHEYYAGNFLHCWTGLICCFAGFFLRRPRGDLLKPYIAGILVSGLFMVLYLRWQPWISRLQLPLFMVGAVVIGIVLDQLDKKGRVIIMAGILFLLAATPWLVKAKLKPVIGKRSIFSMTQEEKYFINRPYLQEPFERVMALVRESGCRDVGLLMDFDAWEYPYWALARQQGIQVDFRHIDVKNISQKFEIFDRVPCMIIQDSGQPGPSEIQWQGHVYAQAFVAKPLSPYIIKH